MHCVHQVAHLHLTAAIMNAMTAFLLASSASPRDSKPRLCTTASPTPWGFYWCPTSQCSWFVDCMQKIMRWFLPSRQLPESAAATPVRQLAPFHCHTMMCHALWPFIRDLWSKKSREAPCYYLTTPVADKQAYCIVPALHHRVYLVWEKTNTIIRTSLLSTPLHIFSINNDYD